MEDDYVIVVRTYKRPLLFKNKIFNILKDNNLLDRLFVFVADQQEKDEYEKILPSNTRIIIGEKGLGNVTRLICNYFPINKRILFMDDDLSNYFGNKLLPEIINEGFKTIDDENCGAFTFSFISNKFWIRDKPDKEIRPFLLAGCFFGTRNCDLIYNLYSHTEDSVRTARYLEKYGKICLFWKCGFKTKYVLEKGGLQDSGERNNTKEVCEKAYNENDCVRKYFNKPTFREKEQVWYLKMKRGLKTI